MTNDRFIPNRKFSRLHDMPLDDLYCKQQSFSQYSSKINEYGKFNNKILTNKNNNYSHHISGFRNHIIKKKRNISDKPFIVLDAPYISNNFYTNILTLSFENCHSENLRYDNYCLAGKIVHFF